MVYFDAALCLAVVRTVLLDYQETSPQRFDAAATRRQSAEFSNGVVVIDVSAGARAGNRGLDLDVLKLVERGHLLFDELGLLVTNIA
jgi:hypothetical protein